MNKITLSSRANEVRPGTSSAGNNTALRILSSFAIFAAVAIAAIIGTPGVMVLSIAVSLIMIYEWLRMSAKKLPFMATALGTVWLLIVMASAIALSYKIWVMLILFVSIAATDVGAWFFGQRIKSEKLFPSVSAGKTWGGHIMGAVCGTVACFATGVLVMGEVMPQLIWIGIGIATLSQYGDLLESYFKRKCGVKDSSNLIPGHGGFLDRFDGWILVLPLMAFISEVL